MNLREAQTTFCRARDLSEWLYKARTSPLFYEHHVKMMTKVFPVRFREKKERKYA